MFFKKPVPFFYGQSDLTNSFYSKLFYCPHPFTNWSLNPLSKYDNELMHTCEGFRKTSNSNSIKIELEDHSGVCDIYTFGGSTTYCDGLYNFKQSWPYKLRNKINENSKRLLINGGCGGWSSIQSLIRYSTWGALIKPKITIFYQSKNDLTPLYNGRKSEKKIFPLLENIMLQLDTSFNSNARLYKKNNAGLASVYSDKIYADKEGLNRLSEEWKNLYESRCITVTQIASQWNGKVLFIPEIYAEDSPYFQPLNSMHEIMKNVADNADNSIFFDIRKIYEHNSTDFLDNTHFSEKGSERFSDYVCKEIKKII